MLKFSLKIGLILTLLLVSNIVLTVIAFDRNTPKYQYLSALPLKYNRLRQLPSPRIILVGGSGLNFGLDGARIEQAMKMPVVNMGLHIGLGLRFNLSEIQDELKPGDIVIIGSEYEQYYSLVDGEAVLLSAIYADPNVLRYITSRGQVQVLAGNWFEVSQEMVKARLGSLFPSLKPKIVYGAIENAYDAQGDLIAHLGQPQPAFIDLEIGFHRKINPEAIETLNQFEHAAVTKGAKVYLLYPAIPEHLYTKNQRRIQKLCRTLEKQTNLRFLDAAGKYAFPMEYFFDTIYHLNATGRQVRTTRLIEALERQVSVKLPDACS